MGINKVILIGNVGKDPEIRHLENGKARVTLPLATTETYKNKSSGQRVVSTEWHNVVFWTPLAEIIDSYTRKGSKLYIEGKISTRSYEDKDGNIKYITEVIAREMVMLDNKPSNRGDSSKEYSESNQQSEKKGDEIFDPSVASESDDDLPF